MERTIGKPSKKWPYLIGLVLILGSDFALRNVSLPDHAGDIDIGIVVLAEWLILVVLLVFWIPRIEGDRLGSIGFGKFKWRDLWTGVLVYALLLLAWIGSSFALELVGLEV